jgi:ligand-binding SRPBCC domain-containing protein
MLQFQKSSLMPASVEQVWALHAQLNQLQRLVPPWQPVQIVQLPEQVKIGAIAEYRIWLGLLPVPWVNVITAASPDLYFTEQQQIGPLRSWQHHHQFQGQGNATLLTDTIHFELPGADLIEDWLGGWVNSRLSDMFDYRHQVILQACQSKLA